MKLKVKRLLKLAAGQEMNLNELAERACVAPATLNRIVKHGKKCRLAVIGRLARALGCEPEYLLTDEE